MRCECDRRPFYRDPVFWYSLGIYVLNRLVLKPFMGADAAFFHGHLNDVFLIPCGLPPMLYFYQCLGLRMSKSGPTWREISLHLLFWSIFFEWLGPQIFHRGTADWMDVASYTIGALGAGLFWNASTHRQNSFELDSPQSPV